MVIRNTLVIAATAATVALSTAAFATDAPAPAAAMVKVDVKTVPAELKDGTKIEITGDAVAVVGKDGKKSPAPDAEHTLKDGTKVTTKGGKIVK